MSGNFTSYLFLILQYWLEALQQDPTEIRRQAAEAARKLTVLKVNEKSLSRRYTTLMEQERHLRKENNKLKDDCVQMEATVTERIGYLQRFKVQHLLAFFYCKLMQFGLTLGSRQEMASFKMAALQKTLDESVPSSELEKALRQYNDLTMKYRELLQKDNHLIQRTTTLEHLEVFILYCWMKH